MEREVEGGIGMGNTFISMADSFQCMPKPTTIKKKKEKRKRNLLANAANTGSTPDPGRLHILWSK